MKTLRLLMFLLIILSLSICSGQNNKSIKVFFLYGSKPACGNHAHEKRYFGGIHGGHVSIGIDNSVIGFTDYRRFHIFAHREKINGYFKCIELHDFLADTNGKKYTTFEVPLTDSQYVKLKKVFDNYMYYQPPYDYAFFGMRCASAAYEVLCQIGLFKKKSRLCTIASNFYPKKVRKKMFKLAKTNYYKVTMQKGKTSRKWEKD